MTFALFSFDRLYKYEITDVLKDNGIDVHDDFHIELTITAQNGSSLSSSLIPQPSVAFQPKSGELILCTKRPFPTRLASCLVTN